MMNVQSLCFILLPDDVIIICLFNTGSCFNLSNKLDIEQNSVSRLAEVPILHYQYGKNSLLVFIFVFKNLVLLS